MIPVARDSSPRTDTKPKIGMLERELEALREKNRELEETLDAIRSGEVDAIVVSKGDDRQIYTLEGTDQPYRVLVENIREGALTLSRDGLILYANTRFAEMVQLPPDKVTGTSLPGYICPESQDAIVKALSMITKQACRARVRIRQEKGSLPVLISMNPISDSEDTRISVVVTDRRKDEDRIQLQARMLEAVGDAVIATDPDRKIIYWNAAATKTYGWNAEEVLGHDLAEVKTRVLSKKEDRKYQSELTGGTSWAGEYAGHHRDGHRFPVYAHDAPVFDDEGRLIAIIGASHDISAEKSAGEKLHTNVEELRLREHQLQEALAEKEILLSEIHHRVKNNLTAFISLLSLDGTYEKTDAGQRLRKDLQNRARSMALIHETLYRTGKFSSVDMEVYLTTLIGQVTGSYAGNTPVRTLVEAKGVVLDLARATTAGLIINELVTNSFKYAFPPGFDCQKVRGEPCTVQVMFSCNDGKYRLIISDNGCGLPQGIDLQTTKSLGLKLVNFLARHQLRSKVEVRGDKGTSFIFLLDKQETYP